jgi:peroxiredoxin (alkyl hydroperoxide reductase subunit C)
MQEKFTKMNTELIGISIDSVFSHIAWLKRMRNILNIKR